MTDKKTIFFQEAILEWYYKNGRAFLWRQPHLSAYEYIIAEVLLQRTRAETVNKFYKEFITKFPSWSSIVSSPVSDLEMTLKPVGLYKQRAKRLLNLAKEMVSRNGVFPNHRIELESIPFMGQYIANAVELLVFRKSSPLLDVNMARVLERVYKARTLSDIRYDPYLQQLANKVTCHPKSKELNWAILDHAALVCQIKTPRCIKCPLNPICNYYKRRKFYLSCRKN